MTTDMANYLWGVVTGWFCGGLAMWTYFHWQKLIRTKAEWEAATQELP